MARVGKLSADLNVRTAVVDLEPQENGRIEQLSHQLSVHKIRSNQSSDVWPARMCPTWPLIDDWESEIYNCTDCLPLTHIHRQVQLQWYLARSIWSCADWGRIVFGEGSCFLLWYFLLYCSFYWVIPVSYCIRCPYGDLTCLETSRTTWGSCI